MINSPEQEKTDETQQAPILILSRDVLISEIGRYLSLKERSRIARSCRQLYGFFQSSINKVRLQELQTAVLACKASDIAKISEANPYLLLQKSTSTDHAGRTFKDCSPLQNAVWSTAWRLWPLLLKYLPKEKYPEALKQILELEENGREHGAHYDITLLINALRNYIKRYQELDYDNNPTPEKEAELTHLWCKGVGQPQRLIPITLIMEYCRKDRYFISPPKYETDAGPPADTMTKFVVYDESHFSHEVSWLPLPQGLGDVFAITNWRGGCGWGACPDVAGVKSVSDVDAQYCLTAMIAWNEAGAKKLLELKQMLQNPSLAQEIDTLKNPTLSQETQPTRPSTP